MAKKRLSKLQKWILKNAYLNAQNIGNKKLFGLRKVDIYRFFKNTFTLGDMEIPIEKNFKAFFSPQEYNKINATISRSLRNLKAKNYIKLIGHKIIEIPNFEAIKKDREGCNTLEEYTEKHKDKSLEEMMKLDQSWFLKKDIVIEVQNGDLNKTKFIELTREGIKKVQEIVNVKFRHDDKT